MIKERQLVHYIMKVMWRLPRAFRIEIDIIFWHHLKDLWGAFVIYKPLRRRERRAKKAGDNLRKVMKKYNIQRVVNDGY